MQVKDLTIDELKTLIRETVMEAFEELLPDPDEGKTVKETLKQELLATRKRTEAGFTSISSQEAIDKQLRPFGLCAGEFRTPDDFDAPLPEEILNAFEGK
jgi:hypothetical protein